MGFDGSSISRGSGYSTHVYLIIKQVSALYLSIYLSNIPDRVRIIYFGGGEGNDWKIIYFLVSFFQICSPPFFE